jgi:hypothetical protein
MSSQNKYSISRQRFFIEDDEMLSRKGSLNLPSSVVAFNILEEKGAPIYDGVIQEGWLLKDCIRDPVGRRFTYHFDIDPDYDPTPWCSYCGAKRAKQCKCPPTADND